MDRPIAFDFILESGKEALKTGKEKEAVHWFSIGLKEARTRQEKEWLSKFSSYMFTCL